MSETLVKKRLKSHVTGKKWGYETQVRLAQYLNNQEVKGYLFNNKTYSQLYGM
jgi:hypothetical protein